MLTIRDLDLRYGGIKALSRVSLDITKGETVLLVGANGAGKSSLIKAVCGLERVSGGVVRFDGQDLNTVPCAKRARMGIGYSPEGRRVFPTMTVTENILTGAFWLGSDHQSRTLEWLRQVFPLIAARSNQPAGQLSGGEQQIVAIARAVCSLPKLLLLDEPFLGLAPVWIARISDAIRQLQQRGTTILMTEQMARPALKLAHRAYVMRGGAVVRSGTVEEVRDIALSEEYI